MDKSREVNREIYDLALINFDLAALSHIESAEGMTDGEKASMTESLLIDICQSVELVTTRGVSLMSELDERIEYIRRQKAELDYKQSKVEALREKLKKRLTDFVELNGGRVETADVTLWIKEGQSVDAYDVAAIPDEFMRQPQVVIPAKQPDKEKIKLELKEGRGVDGCRLVTSKNLQIK